MISTSKTLPVTLGIEEVITIHDEVLLDTGGLSGVNLDILEGALGRIENRIFFDGLTDPIEIAAWYGCAVARAHAFVDGNKRTALVCIDAYLDLVNIDIELSPTPNDLARLMEEVAQGILTQKELADWLRVHNNPNNQNQ